MKQHRNKKSFLCQAAFEVLHMASIGERKERRENREREKKQDDKSLKNLTKITEHTHTHREGDLFGCVCQRKTIYNVFASS